MLRIIKRKSDSVNDSNLDPELMAAEEIIVRTIRAHCGESQEIICTSARDSFKIHSPNSVHARGMAIDLRTRNLKFRDGWKSNFNSPIWILAVDALGHELSRRLGPRFWVILHVGDAPHFHIQRTGENIIDAESWRYKKVN